MMVRSECPDDAEAMCWQSCGGSRFDRAAVALPTTTAADAEIHRYGRLLAALQVCAGAVVRASGVKRQVMPGVTFTGLAGERGHERSGVRHALGAEVLAQDDSERYW